MSQSATDQPRGSFAKLRRTLVLPLMTCLLMAAGMSSCASSKHVAQEVRVSIRDQKVALVKDGKPFKTYQCSTSKFGIGDRPGTYATPVGTLRVASKIGAGAPSGAAFHGRERTGEIVKPNTPGRDIIVSRIIRLVGVERENRQTFDRGIYIHGTPEECKIGQPASYGCVRMKSNDVIDLFDQVPVGTPVKIVVGNLDTAAKPVQAAVELATAGVKVQPTASPILPPMESVTKPGQSKSSAKLVARNGKPRLGPSVVSSSTKSSKKSARN
jgi:hypothetical protein